MVKILVIDNYDSFTYNLVQYIERIPGTEVTVVRNDKIGLEEVGEFDKIVISPGPGIPVEAGISKELIDRYGSEKSILGVCLGHQAIAEVYGGTIRNLVRVYHGVSSAIQKSVGDESLFKGVPQVFDAGRYHSWIVEKDTFPDALEVTARNADGDIMALRHREYDVKGVQFHPESVLTEYGGMMIKNWIEGDKS
ncbi:MAG: aminodeoxychorismate/anthranilate synthase component II [Bacteroidales bacterium]